MFDLRDSPRPGRSGRMDSAPGLDARLFIGRDDVFAFAQRLPFPAPLVQVQHGPGAFAEPRVARKDPGLVEPGPQTVLVEDSPDRGPADPCDRIVGQHGRDDLGEAEPREWSAVVCRQLTGDCFHMGHLLGGKRSGGAPISAGPPRRRVPGTTASATCGQPPRTSPIRGRARGWTGPVDHGGGGPGAHAGLRREGRDDAGRVDGRSPRRRG